MKEVLELRKERIELYTAISNKQQKIKDIEKKINKKNGDIVTIDEKLIH